MAESFQGRATSRRPPWRNATLAETAPSPIVRANPRERPRANPMSLFKMIFSWWNSATWGTLLTTWLSGSPVGSDEFGNRYYQNKDGSRRWVIYNVTVEANRMPPDWHGWQ